MKYIAFIITILFVGLARADRESEAKINNFVNSLKGSFKEGGQFGKMGEGMMTLVAVPEKYKYSFKILNESPIPIYVATYRIQPMLGGDIYTEDVIKEKVVPAGSDSGDSFKRQQLKFRVRLKERSSGGKTLLDQLETELGDTTMPGYYDTNYFRVYVQGGDIKAEYLGPMLTTTKFIGNFYNNIDSDVKVDYVKGGKKYSALLDPHSFNLLSSEKQSIRPVNQEQRAFVFTAGGSRITKPLTKEGIVGVSYIYEIYRRQGSVSVDLQGFMLGNFSHMPVNVAGKKDPTRFRDLNPVPCSIWLKSAAQATGDKSPEAGQIHFDEPYPVWLVYKTKSQTLRYKLQPGKSNDINIVRPRLDEKEALFSVVRVLTMSDSRAQNFLDKLANGDIEQEPQYVDVSRIKEGEEYKTMLPRKANVIYDRSSGVTATVLMTAVLTPLGTGSSRVYSVIEPGMLQMHDLATKIMSYVKDSARTKIELEALLQKIPGWIVAYAQTNNVDGLHQYLQAKGTPAVTSAGTVPKALLQGPLSIGQYPILRYAGMSNFATMPHGFKDVAHVQH